MTKLFKLSSFLLLLPRFNKRHTESYASQVHRFSVNRNANSYRNLPFLRFRLVVSSLPLCHLVFASACYFSLALVAAEKQREDVELLSKTSVSRKDKNKVAKAAEATRVPCHIYCSDIL